MNDIKISSQYRQNPKNGAFLMDFDDEKQAEEISDQESEKNDSFEKVENVPENPKNKSGTRHKYKEVIPSRSNGIIARSHVENKSLANFVGSIMSHTPCGPNEKKGTEMSCWK